MARLSRYKVDKTTEKKIIKDFCQLISSLKSPSEVQKFFEGFFTPSELLIFAKRLQAARMLKKHLSYSEISQTLKLSYSTLSRLANQFRTSDFFENNIPT